MQTHLSDTINFMEEVANSVEWMHAELYKCQDGHSIPPIARSILSRKCDFLTMSAASFSAADAESIVQVDKKPLLSETDCL